jgi:hypothetical protein
MNSIRLPMLLLVALTTVACAPATTPTQPTPPPAMATATATATNPEVVKKALTSKNHAGYTLVTKDGQELYCRTVKKTGSRIQRETVCLTAKEIDELADASRRQMNEMGRRSTPPPSK